MTKGKGNPREFVVHIFGEYDKHGNKMTPLKNSKNSQCNIGTQYTPTPHANTYIYILTLRNRMQLTIVEKRQKTYINEPNFCKA